MNELLIEILTNFTSELIGILGLAAAPLLVCIFYRVFRIPRLSSMSDENIEREVLNACYSSIHAEIQRRIEGLVLEYFGQDFVLPAGLTYFNLATWVHHDSRVVADLAAIVQSLSTLGMQSPEFQLVLSWIEYFAN